jgi:ribosomal protein S18 acetylase RimI-like enzyme
MIRLAKKDEMQNLLRMGESFFHASGYGAITEFNRRDTEKLIVNLIELGTLLTDGKNGMIGFVIYPLFMNNSTLMSQELFWWVDEDRRGSKVGLQLLRAAEEISKESGADVMNMLSLNELDGEKVNSLYRRLGYKSKEQSYMRVL